MLRTIRFRRLIRFGRCFFALLHFFRTFLVLLRRLIIVVYKSLASIGARERKSHLCSPASSSMGKVRTERAFRCPTVNRSLTSSFFPFPLDFSFLDRASSRAMTSDSIHLSLVLLLLVIRKLKMRSVRWRQAHVIVIVVDRLMTMALRLIVQFSSDVMQKVH